MYKSPIEIIQGEPQTKLVWDMDGAIMKAVQKVNIIVDKDQLLHALAYDRGQYQLGFRDGKEKAIDELVRCKDCKYMCHYTDGHIECRLLSDLKPIPTTYCTMKADDFCSYGERRTDEQSL